MIKVSVFIATYNHEPYIAQSIESALNQLTQFDYEILIGEDCSTDKTREIVQSYADKHPDKIRLILHDVNVGGHKNLDMLIRAPRGEYLAWLEGDDYWTDNNKLQKQVDILDANHEVMISCHNISLVDEKGTFLSVANTERHPETLTGIKLLIAGNYIYTPSCMFRHNIVDVTPLWIHKLGLGDWPRHLILAQHGFIHYMPDVMASYRQTTTGVWFHKDLSYRLQNAIMALEEFNIYSQFKYNTEVRLSQLIGHSLLLRHEKAKCKTFLSKLMLVIKGAFEEIKIVSKIRGVNLFKSDQIRYVVSGWKVNA